MGGTTVIRVLIADDHRLVREGLRLMLSLDSELEVAGEATNGEETVRQAQALRPDIVLMDLQMPVLDGIAATAAIKVAQPEVEVLVLTSVLRDTAVVGAIRAGAIGYLHKDTDGEELRRAIKVKTHVRNILAKFGVRSRTQAVLHAQQRGLAPIGPGE
jgi:DNA-binding NarL/FixJ family response regulator